MTTYKIPLKTVSENNLREHWAPRAKRAREARGAVFLALGNIVPPQGVRLCRLCRVAPRALDTDNLTGALKATRDAVAAWLRPDLVVKYVHKGKIKRNTGHCDKSLRWEYDQRSDEQNYRVDVELVLRDYRASILSDRRRTVQGLCASGMDPQVIANIMGLSKSKVLTLSE